MVGELHVCVGDERNPPALEGLDADDGEWVLSLDPYRDLLVDITGVDPTDELTQQELVTMRARLEGYVEREKRTSSATTRPTEEESNRTRSPTDPFRRLVSVLVDLVPSLRRTRRPRESTDRRNADRSYSLETVQRLAAVFRAAIEARRAEIQSANAASAGGTAASAASTHDTAAD